MTDVSPSDTNWASSAGFHFTSSGELLTAGPAGSTVVSVSSVSGIVTIAGNSTVIQGTTPWTVAGNSTVIQGTSPWVVGGNSSIRANLSSTASDNPVQVSGNSTVFQGGAPWSIAGNSTVIQGTNPWIVSPNSTAFVKNMGLSVDSSNALTVKQDASVRLNIGSSAADNAVTISGNSTVFQGGAPWSVGGNSTVIQGTSPWIIGGNSTVVILSGNSSVTVSNTVTIQGNSTVTVANTVTIQGNCTAVQGTTPWVIGGNSSVRVTFSSTAADNPVAISGNSSVWQGSTAWQVQVTNQSRVTNSSAADFLVRPIFSSTNTDNPVRAILSSTGTDNPVTVSAGNSSVTITAGNSSVIITTAPIGWNRTGFGTKSGQLSSAGDNTLISSVAAKTIYVYGWTLTPLSTGANLIRWMDGSTNEVWRARVLGGSTSGMNYVTSELAVTPPAYLFKTAAASFLGMNATSSGVNYGVAYWQE